MSGLIPLVGYSSIFELIRVMVLPIDAPKVSEIQHRGRDTVADATTSLLWAVRSNRISNSQAHSTCQELAISGSGCGWGGVSGVAKGQGSRQSGVRCVGCGGGKEGAGHRNGEELQYHTMITVAVCFCLLRCMHRRFSSPVL